MAAVTTTAKNARPLDGSTTRQKTAGEAIDLGMTVYLATDGKIYKTANASAKYYGVLVAGSNKQDDVVAGEMCTVVVHGPVLGFSGMQPGLIGWLSSTAGKIDQTTGTVGAGYAESADIFFVLPTLSTAFSS